MQTRVRPILVCHPALDPIDPQCHEVGQLDLRAQQSVDTVALKEVGVGVIYTRAYQEGYGAELEGDSGQPPRQDSEVDIGKSERATGIAAAAFELGRQPRNDEDANPRACTPTAVHVAAIVPGRVAAEGAELHRPPLLRYGGHGPDERRDADHDCF